MRKKNIVVIVVYNRYDNLVRWLDCWEKCEQEGSQLVIIHNFDTKIDHLKYRSLCKERDINYIPRRNRGMDIGAFQDVVKERLRGFDNDWDTLLWITDDFIPMRKDFVSVFTSQMKGGIAIVGNEISRQNVLHLRTSGFCIRKDISKKILFPADPIQDKSQCYNFEHGQFNLLKQIQKTKQKVLQATSDIHNAPLWDTEIRAYLKRMDEFNKEFSDPIEKICIVTTFDRNYKKGGETLFNSIRRHTNCTGIDFKVITSDIEVLNELGKENCHFVTEEIKARYSNVKYSKELPVEKYATSWYRYEIFNMTEYNRVICIDSDCICVKDISFLFSEELNKYDIISVEDHIVSKCFNKLVPELERQGLRLSNLTKRISEGKIDIQPALLVANKTIIREEWYKNLLNYANTAPFSYSIDEGVLNDFIYMEDLRVKLLPLEWDYQDIYEQVCPELPVPSNPIIVHCQESKPFIKSKNTIDKRMHKWHDLWWKESISIYPKTLVVIIIWNRFENLERWINCWNQCIKKNERRNDCYS